MNYLFARATAPPCRKSADTNDDGVLNVSDAVGVLIHLFASNRPLPGPTDCGVDPTADALGCESQTCES